MKSNASKSGTVLARVGSATINITDENKIYVVYRGVAAFATSGAKGVIYFDRDGFTAPKAVIEETARLLGIQRTNRIKNWRRSSPDHYDEQDLQLVTLYR